MLRCGHAAKQRVIAKFISNETLQSVAFACYVGTGPSPGFRSKGGQKPQGRPHFLNTILDVCSFGGPNMRKMFCMVGQLMRRLRIKVEHSSARVETGDKIAYVM